MRTRPFKLGGRPMRLLVPETENERQLGLVLLTKPLPDDEGMTFENHISPVFLHTFGMHFSIDVVWLGSDGSIISVDQHVKPGRFVNPKTPWAIEVADGWVSRNLRGA